MSGMGDGYVGTVQDAVRIHRCSRFLVRIQMGHRYRQTMFLLTIRSGQYFRYLTKIFCLVAVTTEIWSAVSIPWVSSHHWGSCLWNRRRNSTSLKESQLKQWTAQASRSPSHVPHVCFSRKLCFSMKTFSLLLTSPHFINFIGLSLAIWCC